METNANGQLGDAATEDPLGRRYRFKLATNIVRLPLGVATQAVIPRLLGPGAYGDFSFVTSTFEGATALLSTGSLTAFYTKLSSRPSDHGLVRFYLRLVALASITLAALVLLAVTLGWGRYLWPGQSVEVIWMGAAWGLLTWYGQVILKVVDAYALTTRGEVVRMAEGGLATLIVFVLFFASGTVSLTEFFLYRYGMLLFLLAGLWFVLYSSGALPVRQDNGARAREYLPEFWRFSSPLIVLAAANFLAAFVDRWLLQTLGGSEEQGFFALSQRVAATGVMFTTAMTPLLLREYSRAFARRDIEGMRRLFERYVPLLYSVVAFFSVFGFVQAEAITRVFGGLRFEGAIVPVAIMSLYPIYQTYGQLSGSVFYAAEHTTVYRNIGAVSLGLGVIATWFFVGPTSWGGLGLEAVGLALKTLLVAIVSVNLQLWFNARFLRLSFATIVTTQVAVIITFSAAAWAASRGVEILGMGAFASLALSGVLYLFLSLALVMMVPGWFGVSREIIESLRKR